MARPLDFMALSWVRLGRASFLTSVSQFWAEKSKSSTVVTTVEPRSTLILQFLRNFSKKKMKKYA